MLKSHKKKAAVLLAFSTVWTLKKLYQFYMKQKRHLELKANALRKRQQINAEVQMSASLPMLTEEQSNKILSATILVLQDYLSKGEVTCEEIFLAYMHQARVSSHMHNCIMDLDVNSGWLQAKELDLELQSGRKRSDLHGIPISVKDTIAVKSLCCSFGCASLCNSEALSDAYLIEVLRKKGAIIFMKSAVSQNSGSYETKNLITGITTNPHNILRSSGGSSGGDAVLVHTKGTCIGLGTDVGGSLRVPSAACGVYTLKPTSSRVSRSGPNSLQDCPGIKNAFGPICRSVDDLIVFFQEVLSEPPCKNLPWVEWKPEVLNSKKLLKIAYCLGSDYWPIPECLQRGVREAKEKLENNGHTLVEFILENEIRDVTEIKLGVYGYDQRDTDRLGGEKPLDVFVKMGHAGNMPHWMTGAYEKYMKWRYGEKESFYYKSLGFGTAAEYVKNIIRMKELKKAFYEKIALLDVDVLLFPCPFPAIPHDTSMHLLPGCSYFGIFNILDFPTGVVPIGSISDEEQNYGFSSEIWSQTMQKVLKDSKNLPISIQVSGFPFTEEKVLRVMKELSKAT